MKKDDHIPFKTGPLAGMTHKEILKQAEKDDKKKLADPFVEGEKKFGSKKKMFKESTDHLKKISIKGK